MGSCRGSALKGMHRGPVSHSPQFGKGKGKSERCQSGLERAVISKFVLEH